MGITVNGKKVEWEEGMTVKSLLKKMQYSFPMIIVKIDGKLVPKDKYEATDVPDGAKVDAIHLIAGG